MKYESCKGCPYYDRPGPLFGHGAPDASIAFIGDHPTADDMTKGEVFTQGTGRILDNAAWKVQINRQRQFSSHLVKCKVGAQEQVYYKAVEHCKPLLDMELGQLRNLKVIATLGETAFHAFTGKNVKQIINRPKAGPGRKPKDMHPALWLRGCPYPVGRKVIIPLLSPQFLMKSGFMTAYQFDSDMQKVAKYANGKGRFYKQIADYSPSTWTVREVLERCARQGYGGLDIETPEDADEDELRAGGKHLDIALVGISPAPDEAIGITADHFPLLGAYLADKTRPIKWYVFNGAFDFYHLSKRFTSLAGVSPWDVMLGLNRWRSDLMKKDLGTAMSFFTDMEYTKNLSRTNPIKYQWADTCGVLEAGLTMERVLEFQGLLRNLVNQDFPLQEDLVNPNVDGLNRMREVGINANIREVARFMKVSEMMLAKYTDFWKQKFPMVDWQSPQQLFDLFTGVFKLPVIMRKRVQKKDGERTTKTTPTCDVEALKEYRDKHGNQTAGLVLAMREMKHLGDFAGIVAPDRRIHTTYLIHRQVQFRIQAVEPNIQQLPEELGQFKTRRMVQPDNPEEDAIITIDASQCELRIYAYLAKAVNLLKAMNSGIYIYGFMYEQIYGRPFFKPGLPKTKYNKADYVTPQEILAAKSGPLGYIYDRGWESVATKHKVSAEIAKASHSGFHRENPEIREFHRKVDSEVKKLGYQDNLWGGRRYFPLPKIQRNEYLSFHGQSNMGELLRANYLKPAFRSLPDFGGSRVLLTVHDSMGVNARQGKINLKRLRDIAQFLYDAAEASIPEMEGTIIPAEVKYGPNWGDQKAFKTIKEGNRTVVLDVEKWDF